MSKTKKAKSARCAVAGWLGEAEARREIKAGMVIAAIKIIRARNHIPLLEAMNIVEAWSASSNAEIPND